MAVRPLSLAGWTDREIQLRDYLDYLVQELEAWSAEVSLNLPESFIGARVRKSSSAGGQDYTTKTNITYDAEDYDTNDLHSLSSNTDRFTIPSIYGGRFAFVTFHAAIVDITNDQWVLARIEHYDSDDNLLQPYNTYTEVGVGVTGLNVNTSGPTPVSTGDYFVSTVLIESDPVVTFSSDSVFAIEIVGRIQ